MTHKRNLDNAREAANVYWAKEENRKKMSERRKGSGNPYWKGDGVGYAGLHAWIKAQFPNPGTCNDCKESKALDLANISNKYLRDVNDWEYLCRRCHMKKDGRIEKLRTNGGSYSKPAVCVHCSKSYIAKSGKSKYCSRECSMEVNRIRSRAAYWLSALSTGRRKNV